MDATRTWNPEERDTTILERARRAHDQFLDRLRAKVNERLPALVEKRLLFLGQTSCYVSMEEFMKTIQWDTISTVAPPSAKMLVYYVTQCGADLNGLSLEHSDSRVQISLTDF